MIKRGPDEATAATVAIADLTAENEQLRGALRDAVALDWVEAKKQKPPLNRQVLVCLRNSVGGTVCDVACYTGAHNEDGEDRWILADIRLETRQIAAWAAFRSPPEIAEDRARLAPARSR